MTDHQEQGSNRGGNVPIPPPALPRNATESSKRASLVFQHLHASGVSSPLHAANRSSVASTYYAHTPRNIGRSLTEGSRVQRSSVNDSILTSRVQSRAQQSQSISNSPQDLLLSQSLPHPWAIQNRHYSTASSRDESAARCLSETTPPLQITAAAAATTHITNNQVRDSQIHTSSYLGALEEASIGSFDLESSETELLLSATEHHAHDTRTEAAAAAVSLSSDRIVAKTKSALGNIRQWTSGLSPAHINVFKAVLAYAIASLVPFVPFLRDKLGDIDYMSPHLVTNATIWFHAAKPRSGLTEGGLVGLVWVLVTSYITYAALFIAEWLHIRYAHDTLRALGDVPEALPLAIQSKVVSLVVFVFGLSWCLAFFKANTNRPSVGTATAISNVVLYLVMLREAPIVNYKAAANGDIEALKALLKNDHDSGKIPWPFPSDSDSLAESVGKKTEHILAALLTGMTISLLVGWFVRPTTAGQALRTQLRNTFASFREILPQLLAPFVSESAPSNTQAKLRGAKPDELKEALRAHRQRLQQLKKQLAAVKLEPAEWHVWAKRKKLGALVACLDGLSLHLSSMSSGLELRVIDHNSDAFEGDLDAAAYSAIIQRIREPVVQLGRMCDKTLMAIQDMVDGALDRDQQQASQQYILYAEGICECGEHSPAEDRSAAGAPGESQLCDACHRPTDYDPVTRKIMRLRVEMVDAIQAFHDDYDDAVNDLANVPLTPQVRKLAGPVLDSPSNWQPPLPPVSLSSSSDTRNMPRNPSSSSTTEEQLFIVYFFVFSMREFVDELFGILPQVAAVCRPTRPFRHSLRRSLQPKKILHRLRSFSSWVTGHFWALWDTGATTELETRYEVAQFTDPRSLHAPRPATRVQRLTQAIWRACMWARRLNVKFATKYALLITLLSLPCYWSMDEYLEFRRQRLEWMVISAAAIMVPTVGGSALVSVYRILGTCAGGLAAFLVYEIGRDAPLLAYVLLVLFSIPCFHMMLNSKYPKIGQFALMTFGVVLINKWVAREDQSDGIGELAIRRTASVALGVFAGMVVTMYVWPFEARVRVRQALSWWLLTGSLLYDQLWSSLWHSYISPGAVSPQPAEAPADADDRPSKLSGNDTNASSEWHALTTVRDYLDNELQLQSSLMEIASLLSDTQNEPRLKGPFPMATYQRILNACQRLLDAMVAARWVTLPVPMVVASRLDEFPQQQPQQSEQQQTHPPTRLPENSLLFAGTSSPPNGSSGNLVNEFELSAGSQHAAHVSIRVSGENGDPVAIDEQLVNIKHALDRCSWSHKRRDSDGSSQQGMGLAENNDTTKTSDAESDSQSISTDTSVLESGNTTEEEEGRLLLDLPIGIASTVMLEREQHELDSLLLHQHSRPYSPNSKSASRSDIDHLASANTAALNRDVYCGDDDDSDYGGDSNDGGTNQNGRFGRWNRDIELDVSQQIRQKVEEELLASTKVEREQRDALVSLTMYVLASALILKTPLPAVLPPIHTAQRRVAESMRHILDPTTTAANHIAGLDANSSESGSVNSEEEQDEYARTVQRSVARIKYVFYYTQVMLGWEIVQELTIIGGLMRDLYGSYGPFSAPSGPLPR